MEEVRETDAGEPGSADPHDAVPVFRGEIPRHRCGVLYRLTLLLVTIGMVLLPLLYLLLITTVAVLACAVVAYLFLAEDVPGKVRVYGGLLTVFVGPTIVLFLVKPLFAPRARRPRPFSLARSDQPRLFGFVDQLCELVGAPRPSRIDLDLQANASASFQRGLSSLVSRRLVLTLGLPLAGALTAREFGGVLAHEFGHFSQGAGMRLTYVIRSINRWFGLVVLERDGWDIGLESAAREATGWQAKLIMSAALAGVAAAREVLSVLMHVGHAISCLALRQMEYDADSYEVQVAGAPAFESTARKLTLLGFASQGAVQFLAQSLQQSQLIDDLPTLTLELCCRIPEEVCTGILDQAFSSRTGFFDTHPSLQDRLAAARRIEGAGVLQDDRPASLLFQDMASLCSAVTNRFYEERFGPESAKVERLSVAGILAQISTGSDKDETAG